MIQILRNLARRRVRTGLTVFGIAIGVFALTVMGAMSENFANLLDNAERLSSQDIQISPASRSPEDRPDRTTLAHLRQVEGVKSVVTTLGGITVVPEPGVEPEVVAARINDQVSKVRAKSPRQFVAEIRQGLAVFNIIMLGGAVLAGIVGGLAVVNTMIMSVNERTREIGIKKALGAEDRTIVREFLTEAAAMGVIGGLAGAWSGWVAATLLNVVLSSSVGGSNVWLVTPRLIALVLSFALGLGLFAGIFPAWSAARLDPVQALRAE